MSNINELSVSSRTIQSKIIESNGNMTFRLQDKEVTENGNVTADVGYDALSKVNVNVQGGGSGTLYAYGGELNDDGFVLGSIFYSTKIFTEEDDGKTVDGLYITEILRSNGNKMIQGTYHTQYEDVDAGVTYHNCVIVEDFALERSSECDMNLGA